MDKKPGSALTGPPLKKITSLTSEFSSEPGYKSSGGGYNPGPTTPATGTTTTNTTGMASSSTGNGTNQDLSHKFGSTDISADMERLRTSSETSLNTKTAAASNSSVSNANVEEPSISQFGALNGPNAPNGPQPLAQARSTHLLDDPKLQEVLVSDNGTNSLLALLKQSVVSCRELAAFIKKTGSLEGEHNAAVKKLARNTRETLKKPEGRQGTFLRQVDEIVRTSERLSDVSSTYVAALSVMHDELVELAKQIDRSRKSVKETSLRQEKNVSDLETLAEKAQAKYDSLCEEYDKMLAGDGTKNKFGFKQSRTAQHEEELYKKVVAADSDYQQRVTQAQRARKELVEKLRPSSAKQLKDLINEINSALTLQLHKYANLTQTLALNKGFIITPLPNPDGPSSSGPKALGLKDKVALIDNELDLHSAIVNSNKSRPLNRKTVVYREHPTMAKSGTSSKSTGYGAGTAPSSFRNVSESAGYSVPATTTTTTNTTTQPAPPQHSGYVPGGYSSPLSSYPGAATNSSKSPTAPTLSSGNLATGSGSSTSLPTGPGTTTSTRPDSVSSSGSNDPTMNQNQNHNLNGKGNSANDDINDANDGMDGSSSYPPGTTTAVAPQTTQQQAIPVFGTPLETLLDFEESTVPRIVYQCVQAVDNFGLEIEGIYRTNGNSAQVQEIKRMFNTDAANVDLMHPKNNINDIHSVASALKLYFRDLPDPLLTKELHKSFIMAGQIENEIQRRDAVHATVNNLPDPNYTTLRYLIFHLYRVQEREPMNRMSISNLAIVWGPTLMATDYSNVQEMAIQGKVIESIIYNAYVIFDAD